MGVGVDGSSNEKEFVLPLPTFDTFNIFCSVVLHLRFWFLRNTPTLVSELGMFFSDQGQLDSGFQDQ